MNQFYYKSLSKGKRIIGFLPVIFSLFLCYDAGAALSGNYTINASAAASSTNYQTFASAVSDMVSGTRADGGTANGKGISSTVTFNVANGTYTEQISIRPISGASATNRIIFQSNSGDSTKTILTFASSTATTNNFTLQLDSADYITFRKLTIQRSGSNTYGRVIEIRGGANNNQFLNLIVRGTINTATTNSAALIYSAAGTGSKDDNNIFRNNLLKHGSYGFYYFGQSTTIHEYGTVIDGNMIDSTNYHALDIENQDSVQIFGNIITNVKGATSFGMNLRYVEVKSSVRKNKIDVPNGTKGMHLEYTRGTAANPQVIANNFISLGGTSTTGRGLDIDYNQYLKFYYNNVHMYGTGSTASALYLWSGTGTTYGNITLKNNNFANTGGGYAVEITATAVSLPYIDTSNYNNFYTSGSTFGKWGTTTLTDLAGWKSASGFDANSVSFNPRYISNSNLHTRAAGINGKATPITGFTTDIDGETRSTTTPDIGADEFTPAPLDAGLTLFVNPVTGCAGTQNVTVRLRNAGTTKIDTVTITYLLDGVQQSSKQYYPNLTSTNTTDITVGTVGVTSTAKFIKVFVSDPNNSSDADPSNDTITMSIRAAIPAGTYTIGGTSPNYSTFTAAVNDLKLKGICGPVTFNVADGIYREKLIIPAISGASATNTITFKSVSGDSSKVILLDSSSASSTNNFLLLLDGADYITFRNMTLTRPGTLTYATVIEISNVATNNKFLNNRILGGTATASSTNKTNIFSTATLDDNNTFRSNLIRYGSYAFYYRGASTTSFEKGTVIEDNIVDSAYIYGINIQYHDAPVVSRNKVTNNITATSYGIYLSYCQNGQIVRENQVIFKVGGYGIYPTNCVGTTSARGLIANNMISMAGTGTAYGIYLNGSAYQDIFYNSSLNNSTSATGGRAIYVTGGTGDVGNRILNNIFANTGGGVAYYVATAAITANMIDTSDFNDLYATGSVLGTWGATDVTTIAAWRTASNQDPNSVSADPKFVSSTDLHSSAIGLNGKALPLSQVTTDIDGQARNSTTPDIGADEFTPPANDLAVTAIISPASNICGDSVTRISVAISNEGANAQSNFTISGNVTGSATQSLSHNYSGTLASLTKDTITFSTTLNTYKGGTYNIIVYTALTGDANKSNDTAKVTVKILGIPNRPKVSNFARCQSGSVSLIATKDTGMSVEWFSTASATTPLFTGDTFKTPVLNSSTTYYAQASAKQSGSVGAADNTIGAGGYTTLTYALIFDAHKTITIDSVAMYASAAGTAFIELRTSTGTVLATRSVNISVTNTKVFVPVGFIVPAGTDYRLQLNSGSSSATLYRNTAGASYPYTIPGMVSITGNTFSGYPQYYYYFYNWHVSSLGCPSPRVPVTVTINSRPQGVSIIKGSTFNGEFNTGTANAPDSVCTGNTIMYELTPPTGFTNADFGTKWSVTNITFATGKGTGASDTTLSAPTSTSNGMLTFSPIAAEADSTYIFNITVKNLTTGCDTTVTRYIHVSPTPVANFTTANVCMGNNMLFTNTTTATRPGTKFRWYFGDGSISDSINAVHNYAATGTYTVSLVAINATGCNDSIAKQVEVYPNPVANFAAISVCSGQSVQFIDSSSIPAGTIASRVWYFGDNATSTVLNPSHKYDSIGSYSVKLVVTSANGCKDSITKTVNVYAQPVAGFTTANVCLGDTVSFTNTSNIANGTLSYVWSFGDGDTSSAISPVHFYAVPGNYTVTLLVISPNQCADTISQNVRVYSLPSANFTSGTVAGRTLQFNAADTTLASYTWDFGDGDNSAIARPTHTYSADGKYKVTLRVRNANGCEMEFSDSVDVILTGILDAPKADISVNIFPNPFQLQTNVVYTLDKTARVRVSVYDLSGKEITVIADQKQSQGKYTYTIDAESYKMNAGIYLLRVLVDDNITTKQIIRLK